MEARQPTSLRLLPGVAVALTALLVFSAYTISQLRGLTRLQTEIIDRNRADSLLLLRIQNNLNALGTAMRDMVDASEPYPLSAWRSQFRRIRVDLKDAVKRESAFAPATRTADQSKYLTASIEQFWDALDRIFVIAETDEAEARTRVRLSLQARHEAVTANVARLLVQNHESEQEAARQTQQIYTRVERNVYAFLVAMLIVMAATSIALIRYNRRVFEQVTDHSQRRSELAQQLIAAQENTLRSISRELHDDFGQTLTAVGIVLERAHRSVDGTLRRDLHDIHDVVQTMLDRMRSLSHSLHPVILDEMGLEGALETYIPLFERRTGIAVRFVKSGQGFRGDRETATHIYRVFQEALNNVARHSGATSVDVRMNVDTSSAVLEVEDNGSGFAQTRGAVGLGLVSMRERAEMLKGRIEFMEGSTGGALIRFTVPLKTEEAHVGTAI